MQMVLMLLTWSIDGHIRIPAPLRRISEWVEGRFEPICD